MALIPRQDFTKSTKIPRNLSEDELRTGFSRALPKKSNLLEGVISAIPALAVEAVDITSASIGFTERDQITAAATEDMPGFRDFILENRGALEAGVGVASILLAATPAGRITKTGGTIGRVLAQIPGIGKITKLDNIVLKAKAKVRIADRKLAKEGIAGPNAVNADVLIKGQRFTRKQLANDARRKSYLRGGLQGAAAELGIYAIGNENEFLYSDEVATNVFLAGLGIVIPGVIDGIITNSQARRFLTDDRISRVAADAVDRGGFNKIVEKPLNEIGEPGKIIAAGGLETDTATRHFLAADAKLAVDPDSGVSSALFSNRRSAAVEDLDRGFKAIDRVSIDGIPGTEGTGFRLGKGTDTAIGQHVRVLSKLDPAAFFGSEFIGKIPEGITPEGMMTRFAQETDKLKTQVDKLLDLKTPEGNAAAAAIGGQVRFRESLVPMLARNLDLIPIEDAGRAVNPPKGKVVTETSGIKADLWKIENSKFAVDDRGQLILPKKANIDSLSQDDIQGLYKAGDAAISAILNRKNPVLEVRKNATWFELDLAAEFLARSGDTGTVKWPQGLDEFSAEVESFAQKADAIKARGLTTGEDFLTREYFNLPQPTSYERGLSGIDDTAVDRVIQGADNGNQIRQFSNTTLKQSLADYRKATDLVEFTTDEIRLRGNSYKLGQDLEGNAIESFFMLKRPFGPAFFSRDHFETRLANRAADIAASISNPRNEGTFIQKATASLLGGEDYRLATRTGNLTDISTTGTLPFRGNTTAQTSFQNFDFAFRDHPEMLAAQRIQDNMRRESSAFFDEVLTGERIINGKTPSEVFSGLRTRQRENSSLMVNQFMTSRRGWELEDAIETIGGMTTFRLTDSAANRTLFKARFGKDMPRGAKLQHGDGTVLRVDSPALEALQSFTHMGDKILRENNALLRARGFGEIKRAAWYIPPRNLNKSFVRFVVDGNGKVIQTLAGNSKADIVNLAKKWETEIKRPGQTLLSQEQVERFTTLWDRAMTGLNDPTIPVLSVGKKRTGSAQSPFVEFNAWEEGLESFQRQFHRLGNDVIEANMRNQLDMARARASALRGGDQPNVPFTPSAKNKERNIHDLYVQALLGQNPLNHAGSAFGKLYLAIEDIADTGIRSVQESIQASSGNPFKGGQRAARAQYERLQKTMADDMPFKDINDFLEQKFATRLPTNLRKITGKINQLTAGLVLKWGETAHSILNITGMINTSPAVIRSFTMRKGENTAQYAKRIGHSAHTFNTTDGVVGVMDMGKIMTRAMSRAWKGEKAFSPDEWKFMRQRGYLNQEVAEFQQQLASMGRSDDKWSKFWDGADKWLGILSTKSEAFSRFYAHTVGLDIAENVMGITSREAKHTFAHDVANKVIANYNPLNRPEMFQGGVGAPLGLFQSYMFNYYQRLYRYVETGDAKAFAMQMAMQGGLFGAVTVPGWQAYNSLYNWTQDGESNPYDGVYKRFGVQAGDLITAGTLSNLPKMFGADGVALFTRGDTTPRLPGANPFPAMSVATKLFTGIGRGIDMFRSDHPGVTGTEVAEVIGSMFSNRPLSGFIDLALGHSVDRQGQVVSTEVRDGMNAIYRMIGLKPLKEQKLTEAYWANKTQNQIRLAQRGRLTRATRAMIRSGNFSNLPSVMEKYLQTGGSPAHFRRYLRETITSATTSKAERQIMEVFRDVNKMEQVNRLLDARINE